MPRTSRVLELGQVKFSCLTYLYDGAGQRVEKSGASGTAVLVYDALGRVVAESSAAGASSPCATCYLVWDHLGTTRLVTDQNAFVMARHDYLPFGEEIPAGTAGRIGLWGPVVDNLEQKFTGQMRDAETGLDYFNARYFAAPLGRFTSPDPANAGADLTNPQSWNAYAYVLDNPLVNIDPSGLDCVTFDNGSNGDDGQGTPCAGSHDPSITNVNGNNPPPVGCVAYGTEGCIPLPVTIGGGPIGNGGGRGTSSGSSSNGSAPAQPGTPPKNDVCFSTDLASVGVGPAQLRQRIRTANTQALIETVVGVPFGNPLGGALLAYARLVRTGGPQDDKNLPQNRSVFGPLPNAVAAGNISFGVTCPFGSAACQFAAGLAQTLAGSPDPNGTLSTGFDTPSDNAQIRQGQAMRAARCR